MHPIPASHLDLLGPKLTFAHLATVSPKGLPQVTPVWFDLKDGMIRVNSAEGRLKSRNMVEGAAVALSIIDPDNAYRYIQVRGRVRTATREGADAHIDSLAKKYLGKDSYPFRNATEVRVMFQIEPTSTSVMG